jgi:hypothetical protein
MRITWVASRITPDVRTSFSNMLTIPLRKQSREIVLDTLGYGMTGAAKHRLDKQTSLNDLKI